ncbi:major facilitator superfamily domain-containing protein [Penicillium atrosanguineum]|nr:major facilitator superfamily domain-containing protein [Penicillium atrosanguineum]
MVTIESRMISSTASCGRSRDESSDTAVELDTGNIRSPAEESMKPLPEGGYGWVCVASVFLINAHTWGVNSAYGVLLSYYLSDHTFPNTSALEYAFVGGLSIAMAFVVSPLSTYIVHHYGMRPALSIGSVLVAVSLITTSFAQKTWQLFLSQGVCFGLGMGFAFVGSVGVVSHWFHKRRSLVNGIVAGGSGIGGLTYSLAVNAMITRLGYPWAMRILGIICFVVNLVCGNLLRLPPNYHPKVNQSLMKIGLFKKPEYISYLAWGLFSGLGYIALLFSLSSYAVAVGMTQQTGSIASALLSLGQALGRPLVGILSDHFGRIEVPLYASMLAGLFCLVIWPFSDSTGVLYFFSIIVGLESGTLWAAAAPIAAEIVGLADLSGALGFFWLVLAPPTAVAEPIAVQLRDSTANSYPYLRVQLFTGFMYIGAGLWLICLKVWRAKSNE